MGWTAWIRVSDCGNSTKKLAGVQAKLLAAPNSQGVTNSVGEVSLGDGRIDNTVQSINVSLALSGYASVTVTVPQRDSGAGGPALPPQDVCLTAVGGGGGGPMADDWDKSFALLEVVNSVTLGRVEGEVVAIQNLLKAVNEVTLGRMERRIKDIQAGIEEEG